MRSLANRTGWAASFVLAAATLAAAGCGWYTGGSSSLGPAGEGSADDIAVQVADRAAYDQLLATMRGNVVLVDFWATWCRPCIASFPHTVELSRQYQGRPLRVVSVSVDDTGDTDRVLEFLRSQGAAFPNLMSASGGSPESFTEFEIPSGAIPHYKLYDKDGTLRYQFTGHSEEIAERVEELLAET
jgi:thiol-disulfide isomerase/thioredoxin